MHQVSVDEISVPSRAQVAHFHESGEGLFEKGDTISARHVKALRMAGIDHLYQPSPGESDKGVIFRLRNRMLGLDEIPQGTILSTPLYDSEGVLLLNAGAPVTEALKERLSRRRVFQVFVRRTGEELEVQQVEAYRKACEQLRGRGTREPRVAIHLPDRVLVRDPETALRPEALDAQCELAAPHIEPAGPALSRELEDTSDRFLRQPREAQQYQEMYRSCVDLAKQMLGALERRQVIDGEQIAATANRLMEALIQDKELLMHLPHLRQAGERWTRHAINVTLLTIQMATAAGFGVEQVLEAAYGAYLHNIGMLRVPSQILDKPKRLERSERILVERHPVFGLDMLEKVKGIPYSSPFVAYHHHERLDGSGYPRGKKQPVIHTFGKMVAVADVYNALISQRPHRHAYLPYHAMGFLLKEAHEGRLDMSLVKTMLEWHGLFPVGSWVRLNSGELARVVGVNPARIRRPIVSVVLDASGRAPSLPQRVDLSECEDRHIVEAIPPPFDVDWLGVTRLG